MKRSWAVRLRARELAVAAMLLGSLPWLSGQGEAASAKEIDTGVDATLQRFYEDVKGGRSLAEAAKGVLVFPQVIKAGVGIGGEHGEGALRIGGRTVDYYSLSSGSVGLQIGVQTQSIVILFMDQTVLDSFRKSSGWTAGVDGSIALLDKGAAGAADADAAKRPIVYFPFDTRGLMINLSLEGSRFARIEPGQ